MARPAAALVVWAFSTIAAAAAFRDASFPGGATLASSQNRRRRAPPTGARGRTAAPLSAGAAAAADVGGAVDRWYVTLSGYNRMLDRHAKRGEAREAERLLEEMQEMYVSGELDEGPDIVSYGSVMDALARCRDDDAPERAEALTTRLSTFAELGGRVRPNLQFFNSQLNCYAERGEADRAEALLEEMRGLGEDGRLEGGGPDTISYSTAIKALANSGIKGRVAVPRAKALVERLEQLHEEGGENVRPNGRTYVGLLKLYAKWGMGEEAENLLARMTYLHKQGSLEEPPNVIAYSCALNAWARSKDRKSVARAEAIFRRMEEDESIQPDVVAYNSLLSCYASRGMAHEAELLLSKMEKLGSAGKFLSGRAEAPDRISYTTVLGALARSKASDAPERAAALLDRMRELHARGRRNLEPDNVTYACVVRCMLRGQSHRSVSKFERTLLMEKLQIESWPWPFHERLLPFQ